MLSNFVDDLFGGRPVRVGSPELPEESDLQESLGKIQDFENDWRVEVPGDPPGFSIDAAIWSATSLYLACSLVIHRDSDPQTIEQLLGNPPPDCSLVESHYSVDLTMRYLPDVLGLARSASNDDPLVVRLLEWARQWPLSSVGIKEVGDVDTAGLRTSATLMRLYVDRIIAAEDTDRLDDPAVSEIAAATLGDYPHMNSRVAHRLKQQHGPPELRLAKNDQLDS